MICCLHMPSWSSTGDFNPHRNTDSQMERWEPALFLASHLRPCSLSRTLKFSKNNVGKCKSNGSQEMPTPHSQKQGVDAVKSKSEAWCSFNAKEVYQIAACFLFLMFQFFPSLSFSPQCRMRGRNKQALNATKSTRQQADPTYIFYLYTPRLATS